MFAAVLKAEGALSCGRGTPRRDRLRFVPVQIPFAPRLATSRQVLVREAGAAPVSVASASLKSTQSSECSEIGFGRAAFC